MDGLQQGLFDRIVTNLDEFSSVNFELALSNRAHLQPNTDFYNRILGGLKSDQLGAVAQMDMIPSQKITMASRHASFPGLTLEVAFVRCPYYYRAYYRIVPIPPDPSIVGRLSPLEVVDYSTILTSVIGSEAKLDAIADGILSRLGSALRAWIEQCTKEVESVFRRERERGNLIH